MKKITHRAFQTVEDIHAITEFLLDTYKLNQTLHNWEPRRWQGQVFHRDDQDYADYLEQLPHLVHIWEDNANHILGVVIPEYEGGVFLQIHPDHRSLEAEMLAWAEAYLMQVNTNDECWLHIWAYDDDTQRSHLLKQRGYTRTDDHEVLRCRPAKLPVADRAIPAGYTLRSMRQHPDDWQGLANLLNAAFNRTFHKADDYKNFQESPFYRAEFDIVVEAPDGLLAANAGFMVHPDASFAMLEPVCTHPEHHGKGLATLAINEGLRRIQQRDVEKVYVNGWYTNPIANHLYQKLGFSIVGKQYRWLRTIGANTE